VFVQAFPSSSVNPGGTAGYEIWVWSTVSEAQGVTVSPALGRVAHVDAPRFTVCATLSGTSCALGDLPTGQAVELVADAHVRDAATAGERITLTATARASKAHSFHAAATVKVLSSSTPPASSTEPTLPTGSDGLGSGSVPSLPQGALTSPTDPTGLFPTVSPNGSGSPTAGRKNPRHLHAHVVSAILPLDPRLIGGQLAGLAVLATAIAIAIVRLSLRKPRPQDGGDAAK